jgi:hypothetical protein
VGVALATVACILLACGGSARNSYRSAIKKQESCCDKLGADQAAECKGGIKRLDAPAEESAPINRTTFYCVDEHFVCDASTGRATRASAQEQLDCLADARAQGR